jgi:hypothetical protein
LLGRLVCSIVGHGVELMHDDGLGAAWFTCSRCGTVTNAFSHHGGEPWNREAQRREVGKNGWTCHACGDYRPDEFISTVSSRRVTETGVPLTTNYRYCNDRPLCHDRAGLLVRIDQQKGA